MRDVGGLKRTNPTPQPSDVGEVESITGYIKALERTYTNSDAMYVDAADRELCRDSARDAVLAAVRTLAGELDAMIAANTELGAQLVDARGDAYNMAKQLTDAQARESRMREALEKIRDYARTQAPRLTGNGTLVADTVGLAAQTALDKATALAGAGEGNHE